MLLVTEDEMDAIDRRLTRALRHVPMPWSAFLETRQATGGASFVRFGSEADRDDELSVELRYGNENATSPDERLDALLDLVAHAPEDIRVLLAEVRRCREATAPSGTYLVGDS